MKLALDTNMLVYAEGWGDEPRCKRARDLLSALDPAEVVLPVQALGELQRVLTGKAKRSPQQARAAILSWCDAFPVADSTATAMWAAQDLAVDHQMPIWDALILAIAAQAECRVLLSEDFQAGFTWAGVTVVNPFSATPSPLLTSLLPHPRIGAATSATRKTSISPNSA